MGVVQDRAAVAPVPSSVLTLGVYGESGEDVY